MPKHLAPVTLQHSHKHKISFSVLSLFFSLSLSLSLSFLSLPVCKIYCNNHKKQNLERQSCVCVHGCRSPLQCPWVLSISGKEARLLVDCRGCCVRSSRPRPRSERSAYPSIVIFYRLPTPYFQINRRCYHRRYSPRIFSPCAQTNPCSIRYRSSPSPIRVPRAVSSFEALSSSTITCERVTLRVQSSSTISRISRGTLARSARGLSLR